MTPIRVLELRSVWGTGGGPEKTILLGTARTDPSRYAITVCYLRDARDTVFGIDARASHLPIDYVELIERHSFDVAVWPALRRLVRERQIDIVHAHDYKTNVLAVLLNRIDGVAAMSTVHGWTGASAREKYLYYPVDKHVLRLLPRVVTVSDDIRQQLVNRGANPARVRTVLNGIDHLAFRRERTREQAVRASIGLTPEDTVIGSVGRLEIQKRFDLLIEAVATLRPQYPRLKLVIVGDGSLRGALADQISRLNLDGTCVLLGHRNDVADLHHAFDLFVQSSDYEGTPNSVLEAMAMESPVVATAAGGTAQLLRDGIDGLVVAVGDTHGLLSAIRQSLDHPARAREWTLHARHRVETDLSFETRMHAVESVYDELMAGQRRTPGTSSIAMRA